MIHKQSINYLILTILILLFTGCGSTYATKGSTFPKMYAQKPKSLLILPPINESKNHEAVNYYVSTIEVPFTFMGYYVFPSEIVSDIIEKENLYNIPVNKYYKYFGADAVLITKIKKWDVSYAVIASTLTVSVECKIISTKTSDELWKYTGTIVVDLSGGNTGNGLGELTAKILITAISTATSNYIQYAKIINNNIVYTLPKGPYNKYYMKDQSVKIY